MMMAMSEYCSEKIMEVIEQVGKTDWGATNKRKYDSAVYNLE